MRWTRTLFFLGLMLASVALWAQSAGIIRTYLFNNPGSDPISQSNNSVSVASVAPPYSMIAEPDSGTEPFLDAQSSNRFEVGARGLYGPEAVTNQVYRSAICETQDGSNHPQGWTVTETAGDGTAAADCTTTDKASGTQSLKIAMTGTTSVVSAFSQCITTGIGSDVRAEIWAKKDSGTTLTKLQIVEWDAADCTSSLGALDLHSGDITTDWVEYSLDIGSGDWNGSTSSYSFKIREEGNGGVELFVDAPQVMVSSVDTDAFCGCDTDAACVCNTVIPSTSNPLHAGTWTIQANAQGPIDASDSTVRRLLYIPATSGNQNKMELKLASNLLIWDVYNSVGAKKSMNVNCTPAANTEFEFYVYHTDNGRIGACCDGTCGTEATGATIETPASTLYLVSTDSAGGQMWTSDFKIYRRLVTP